MHSTIDRTSVLDETNPKPGSEGVGPQEVIDLGKNCGVGIFSQGTGKRYGVGRPCDRALRVTEEEGCHTLGTIRVEGAILTSKVETSGVLSCLPRNLGGSRLNLRDETVVLARHTVHLLGRLRVTILGKFPNFRPRRKVLNRVRFEDV